MKMRIELDDDDGGFIYFDTIKYVINGYGMNGDIVNLILILICN